MKSILRLGNSGNARVLSLILMVAMVWLLPVGNAAAVPTILDDFRFPDVAAGIQQVDISGSAVNTFDRDARTATGVIGGTRYLEIGVVSQGTGGFSYANASDGATNHRYTFQLPDQVDGSGVIDWNASLNVPPGSACGLNLDLSGYSKFILREVTADHAFTLNIQVWNSTCSSSTTRTVAIPVQNLVTTDVLFSSFPNPAIFAGSVGRISLFFTATGSATSLDWSFHSLEAECVLPAPVATITATPNPLVPPTTQTNLCWNVTGTTTGNIVIDQGIGIVPASGCQMVTPGTLPKTYTITAQNGCAPTSASVTVRDAPPPGKVPNLTEWGTIILALILAVSAVVLLRRRRSVS